MSKKKKAAKQKKTPVLTGGDFRAVERSAAADAREKDASAPDGVSGEWR
ncbi:MAG: hypothetical protein IJQ43_04680 [Oscillospiraceae bacterium]|nr:hypothetical protein [Oscillospiraceae bacterium]